jgi:hypothetical protein
MRNETINEIKRKSWCDSISTGALETNAVGKERFARPGCRDQDRRTVDFPDSSSRR